MVDRNEGIIQSGGSINVGGSLAVGRNAVARSEVSDLHTFLQDRGLKEIGDKLDALLQAISQHAQAFPNPDDVHRNAQEVVKELRQEKPSKNRLTSILENIASGVKSVTSVVGLVEGLKAAVLALF